jgi:hypothetical protein
VVRLLLCCVVFLITVGIRSAVPSGNGTLWYSMVDTESAGLALFVVDAGEVVKGNNISLAMKDKRHPNNGEYPYAQRYSGSGHIVKDITVFQ